MRQFTRNYQLQPHNFYGRFSRLQSRRDRSFLANGGTVAFIALSELKPRGQRYWILRDLLERVGGLAIVYGNMK